MTPTLYFLRSSEQKILDTMLWPAFRLHKQDKTQEDFPALRIHADFFGHSDKDFGLYALVDNTIAGAIWCRILKAEQNANGFIDANTPLMHTIVVEAYRNQGIGTFMMEQFLQEVAVLYPQLSLCVLQESKAIGFYKKFGFTQVNGKKEQSPIDGQDVVTLVKKLQKKEIQRPSDGYDASRWMD
ncbi:MAG TPA: GNAT family N-acetyltransferase [Sulfurimonas sp. UBA12504]|nr:MAG TPA: GNAT family N-acetyltransferase [Sulfurimonas sp. UBA12504]